MTRADWIALDWGTTNLRAWAMSFEGSVLGSACSTSGVERLASGPAEFESALLALGGPWLSDGRVTDVLACGMAGSRQGWIEAPYRPVPAAVHAGNSMTSAPTRDPRLRVHIAGGICQTSPPDVMRGEETQIAGLLRTVPDFDGTAILPGTHNKWARISGGRIVRFTTFMTGELYGLLAEASILRHSVSLDDFDPEAFAEAFAETVEQPESVTARLFALRAGHLLHGAEPTFAASRLSGCLAGVEFAGSRLYWSDREIALVASGTLAEQYKIALGHVGAAHHVHDPELCVLEGLRAAHTALKHAEGRQQFGT